MGPGPGADGVGILAQEGYYEVISPCHNLHLRNHCGMLQTFCLQFCLSYRYYSLSKPLCEADCIEALNLPGGPLEAHWRPTGGLPEAYWKPTWNLRGQLCRNADQNPKIEEENVSFKIEFSLNSFGRDFSPILNLFTGRQSEWGGSSKAAPTPPAHSARNISHCKLPRLAALLSHVTFRYLTPAGCSCCSRPVRFEACCISVLLTFEEDDHFLGYEVAGPKPLK
jgi:hypothetical protein